MTFEPVAFGVALAAWVLAKPLERYGAWLHDRLQTENSEQTAVDEVHQHYLDGDIDEDELEDRLEILVDDWARTIRDLADDEHGIGEEISRKVAREFDTVGEFVAADVEELKAIDDVGQERAERLDRIDPK
jgi:ERCC4-type nuclease